MARHSEAERVSARKALALEDTVQPAANPLHAFVWDRFLQPMTHAKDPQFPWLLCLAVQEGIAKHMQSGGSVAL